MKYWKKYPIIGEYFFVVKRWQLKKRESGHKFRVKAQVGDVLDLEDLEPSKKRAPTFENMSQIEPHGAAYLASCSLRKQAIQAAFACVSVCEWNNKVSMPPAKLEAICGIKRQHFAEIMNDLVQEGILAQVSPGFKDYRYWINPQFAWKGHKEFFYSVVNKFKVDLWSTRKIPGLSIVTAEKVRYSR